MVRLLMNIINLDFFISTMQLLDYDCIYQHDNSVIEFDLVDDEITITKKYNPIYLNDCLFASVTPLKIIEAEQYRLYLGQGDGQGSSGFIVLCEDDVLKWFLFCNTSNPFEDAMLVGDFVLCRTNNDKTWKINIKSPEKIQIGN